MDLTQTFLISSILALLLWCITLTAVLFGLRKFFHTMTRGITKKDLKTILENLDHRMEKQQDCIDTINAVLKEMEKNEKKHLQHAALVRYNPFGDVGGNQSFVLSLLDADGVGYVITSLHNREHTRIYAKEVQPAASAETYSKEEREAVSQALKKQK